ncbi:MAG TPA: hypothetical protein VEB42_07005, partial [Chitinophagaceae bacterium]|nr:hypothetical protein [Chitinophagaceae bacterium]
NDWQMYNGSSWNAFGADGTPGAARNVFIQGDMSTNGSCTVNDITIMSGAELTISAASTANGNVTVKSGGILKIDPGRFIAGGSNNTFEVEDNAYVYVNYPYEATGENGAASCLWKANEKFHPRSVFVIQDWDNDPQSYLTGTNTEDISTYTAGTFSACFGHLIVDMENSGSTADLILMSPAFSSNLLHSDLVFRSSGLRNYEFSEGSFSTTIGGNIEIESGFQKAVSILNTAGTATVNVKGHVNHVGTSSFTLAATESASDAAVIILNVEGNITVTNTGTLDFNSTASAGAGTVLSINLKGDLNIASTALLMNANQQSNGRFNFMGTGDGSSADQIQSVNITSTGANRNRYINFNIGEGAYMQLGANLELGSNSKVTVDKNATLDFGFSGSTALYITSVASGNASAFESKEGSILKITSPQGLIKSTTKYGAATGNVRMIAMSNRAYDPAGTFWYTGKANQVTGDAFGTTSSARQVICDLETNSLTLTPTDSFGVSSTATISSTG